MKASKLREQAFDHKSDYEDVEIAGATCKMRPISLKQESKLQETQEKALGIGTDADGNNNQKTIEVVIDFIIENLKDENFDPIFQEEDKDKLMGMSQKNEVLKDALDAFFKVNGLGEYADEEDDGNKKK